MKTKTAPAATDWQHALKHLVTDPNELFALLELDPTLLASAIAGAQQFPLRVPRRWLEQIPKGTLTDPLLQQILPLAIEGSSTPGYCDDPLQEAASNPLPGILHKYHGRVLVMLTGACAIHCRYCFRRHFPYTANNPSRKGWTHMMRYIESDSSISEVILSGGDPLTANDKLLTDFCALLATIPHLQRIRIHTRVPIVLPERLTADFLTWIRALNAQLACIVVVHINHPQEITPVVQETLLALRQNITLLLNQTVLLCGVNNQADTLIALSETLFRAGVLPYYLHVLDKVAGAAHFDITLEAAKQLHQAISARLPGYLVPKLVCEEPGKQAKTLVT